MADHSPSVRPFTSERGATTVSPWSSLSAAKARLIAITSKRHSAPNGRARLIFNLYMTAPFHFQDGHHDPRGRWNRGYRWSWGLKLITGATAVAFWTLHPPKVRARSQSPR